jgi:hypothetical protein
LFGIKYLLYQIAIAAVVCTFLGSCTAEDEHPFSDVPEIELVGLSHDTVVEFVDDLVLSIRYQDGDGNLGFVEPSKYAVFVRDLRLDEFDGFYIGPLAPLDSEIAIQGVLHIEFPNLFVFGNRDHETTAFEIKFVDRAGNESNLVQTGNVVVRRP